jgi:hypothetical protein
MLRSNSYPHLIPRTAIGSLMLLVLFTLLVIAHADRNGPGRARESRASLPAESRPQGQSASVAYRQPKLSPALAHWPIEGSIGQTTIPKTIQLSASTYSAGEGSSVLNLNVTRSGDATTAASADYATTDAAGLQNCNVANGKASARCDYISALGTIHFAAGETSKTIAILIVDDSYGEADETFSVSLNSPSGASLGSPANATITINDNESSTGSSHINEASFFVGQHYYDFLNRQADSSGLAFWTNEITSCGSNQSCIEAKRINVSAAYFLSIEFQLTGYLVERIYKTAYGDVTGTSTFGGSHSIAVPIIRLNEFLPDTQQIRQGVVVGQSGWEQAIENNRVAFTGEFVQRSRFTSTYAASLTPAQFVDKLFANTGVSPSPTDRNLAIGEFGAAPNTAETAARARALRRVAENVTLAANESNRAFVLMQYFGYLRRNPNDPQDSDYTGYDFWLAKLNQFKGNYQNAEMVKAFITSTEYLQRFGPINFTPTPTPTPSPSPSPTPTPSPSPTDEPDGISVAEITLTDASETTFNPLTSIVRFRATGAVLSTNPLDIKVLRNGSAIAASNIQQAPDAVTLTAVLQEGKNDITLVTYDSLGLMVYKDVTLWAGSLTLTVTVLDETGNLANGAIVTARLGDNEAVFASGTSVDGKVAFTSLPDRTIILDAVANGNRFATVATTGNANSIQYKLVGFSASSTIDNNDISLGTSGWNVGSAPVTVVSHVESPAAPPDGTSGIVENGMGLDAANQDLMLGTAGEGPQSMSRTFQIKPGTKNINLRYCFITSEVPGGYFGTKYNDYYNVTLRSKNGGGLVTESKSMNGLGLAAFDFNGRTAWRQISLPVGIEGDLVQVDITVANVADGLYDSQVVVDFVDEKQLSVSKAVLKDIDNVDLKYLSAAAHTYFSGNTRINGTITVVGGETDQLSSLVLEVIEGGKVVAIANLSQAAQAVLLNHPFGSAGKIEITSPQLLFELPSAEAAKVNGTTNSVLTLQIKAVSQKGDQATKLAGSVEKLVRYTGTNRYGTGRDEGVGGDDWVKPSVKTVIDHFTGVTWNDFSNMNGGPFSPHGSHRKGNDVDGYFTGYENRNAATATQIIAHLNDATYGPRIEMVFVAFEKKETNAFWVAIKDVTLSNGRKAQNVILPDANHKGHFHWRVKE